VLSSAGALCPYSDTLQHALRRSSDFPINQLRVQVKNEMEQLEKAEIGNPKTPQQDSLPERRHCGKAQ
jgi:hypothetical protein